MFDWLRTFWYGRILFLAQGDELARFVNLVSKDGVILYHTQRSERGMRAQIKLADFRRLRRPARRTHTRLHIVAKYGWPFVAARWWRRKGLLLGIVIIASVLTFLSQLVLSISVLGNKNLMVPEVLERAEKLGLKTWVPSKDLDLNGIAKALQEQLPDAAWIGIERHGTNIQIRISEKTRPSIPNEAGNLVASRAGIVKEIMVIDGTPMIHEGETVRAGQVLIASPQNNIQIDSKAPSSVSVARGFVRARVWYSAEAQIPLVEDKVEESGRVAIGRGIKFGSRVIMLTTQNSPFEQSRKEEMSQSLKLWRNWRFPVEGIRVDHIELRNVHIERSAAEARKLAEQAARVEVRKKITQGVPIVEETVRVLSNSSGLERVRVEVETYEDLAVYANP
ncbi:sporulation protein YqfD [Desulfosporosinus sp.]|uniref:sporulation protein YqfD n=1 Tax=Desulfosporosinus sp. TaxID=157907 RepID=UPI000E997D2B|nr:sporulation protein YqfD [Desulfosporosinus sp.]MBC2721057.1 sporulation protein YqfD [Desulfosporosinus sp.]MBC2725621.1 sporulation protein YqfD [Desulfosporosinus sp.]HBV88121.1 sporulation protein YqfD [Desulfosporosinus sp.]